MGQRLKVIEIKNMLKKTLPILNANNINYWTDFGTLLGIVREGDVIAHDYDADFCTDVTQIKKIWTRSMRDALIEQGLCLVKSKNSCFKIYAYELVNDPDTEYFYKKEAVHIDIFIYRFYPKYAIRTNLNWHKQSRGILRKENTLHMITHSFPIYIIKDIEQEWVEAWGCYCNIPKYYHDLLIYRYGNNYMTPKKKGYNPNPTSLTLRYLKYTIYVCIYKYTFYLWIFLFIILAFIYLRLSNLYK